MINFYENESLQSLDKSLCKSIFRIVILQYFFHILDDNLNCLGKTD